MTYDPRARKLYELRAARAGGHIRVDAGPARQHLAALAKRASLSSIADQAGIAQSTLSRLAAGQQTTMQPRVARAILAVEDVTLGGRRKVRAAGTMRRLQALRALGYSRRDLAPLLGITAPAVGFICDGRYDWVQAGIRDRAAAVYDELSLTRPPERTPGELSGAIRARLHAARQGWLPPLAWDDDDIDDPDATPDPSALRRPTRRTPAELVEDVEWILQHDPTATATQIAGRLGYADSSGIQNGLDRAGRRDLLARLARNADLIAGAA